MDDLKAFYLFSRHICSNFLQGQHKFVDNVKFLQILQTRGAHAIVDFYDALKETGQLHLAEHLTQSEAVKYSLDKLSETATTSVDDLHMRFLMFRIKLYNIFTF